MHAIPTTYSGVQFRSRLEARWAAFFDMLKIKWLYEPFDLAGYIPDFILPEFGDLLVEVKPILHMSESGPAMDKIRASGWTEIEHGGGLGYDKCAVVVGADLWSNEHDFCIILNEPMNDKHYLNKFLHFAKCSCQSDDEEWTIADNGFCYKRSHWRPERDTEILCVSTHACYSELNMIWKIAGNLTQWKGNKTRP